MRTSIELTRLEATARPDHSRRAEFGQLMTPARTAAFMASLFSLGHPPRIRLLDAGAGIGSLTVAFLERLAAEKILVARVEAVHSGFLSETGLERLSGRFPAGWRGIHRQHRAVRLH